MDAFSMHRAIKAKSSEHSISAVIKHSQKKGRLSTAFKTAIASD
jgi:hypothetical protein